MADDKTLFAEFWEFIKTNKKWWLMPLIIILLLTGMLILFVYTSSTTYPFIYALF